MNNSIYIAILGDLNGHITLAYRLLKRWEIEHNQKLSAIFQVGDFGAFPPPFKVDKATMRFFEKDQDELSFIDYYMGSDEADEILSVDAIPKRKIEADLFFIKGNHEDFIFLNELPNFHNEPVPVDAYNKIHYLHNGEVYSFHFGNQTLNIVCLGGVSLNNSSGKNPESVHYTKNEYRQFCKNSEAIDIFLTHDAPYDAYYENSGSKEVLEFIQQFQPKLHFCGHYHEDGAELNLETDNTRSFLLNEVNFRIASKLNKGCIAIVEITEDKLYIVHLLDEQWMKEYTKDNFRKI